MKNILVTGVAGFIGYSFSKSISNFNIYGIDNLNDYYDVNLKKNRLKNLRLKNNFSFKKIDMFKERKKLFNLFNKNKFDIVVHLASQPGVRYSLENPYSYINSNICASVNLFEALRKYNFKGHILIASSSSVYGYTENNYFSEKDKSNFQLSLYSASKKSLESIAHSYAHNFKIKVTLMRFFTVYGPWGRPDMAIYKFTDSIFNKKEFGLYNNGEMWRDFTYIDDLVLAIKKLLYVPPTNSKSKFDSISPLAPYRVVNIGNQKLVKVSDLIKVLEKEIKIKPIIKNLPMQKGDVKYTLSNNLLLRKLIKYAPNTKIDIGIKNFVAWYKEYYNLSKIFK